MVSEKDVLEVVCEEGRVGREYISKQLYSGSPCCPECCREYESYRKFDGKVGELLVELLDKNRIAVTGKWKYKPIWENIDYSENDFS